MPAIEAFRDASVPIILEPESVWLITSKLVILSKEGGKAAALSKLIKHSVFRGERKTHLQRRRVRNGRAGPSMALPCLVLLMISTGQQQALCCQKPFRRRVADRTSEVASTCGFAKQSEPLDHEILRG